MNATNKKLLGKMAVLMIVGTMFLGQAVGTAKPQTVMAGASSEEVVYCADNDIVYGDEVFNGVGMLTDNVYNITCDEMVTVASSFHISAPSFTSYEPTMSNYCGAMAGRNVIGFYDRWLTNLIPSYTPGVVSASGIYRYYADYGDSATDLVMSRLYDLMLIGQTGGTTSQNFKNGLVSYANEKGYSASYSSFHNNATSVNLSQLTTAINQNKVGVVMCSQFNFIYGIIPCFDVGYVRINKFHSTTAHMMMVYGYKTLAFYNNGNHVCTKTFLLVSSGFEDCEQGYMEMNDFSVINEAVIVSIA